MVRSNQQAQSECERKGAYTARKEKARLLIKQINRQSGEAVEDPPQVEQKAERDRQKPSVNSSDGKTACMPDKSNGINEAKTVEPVKVYMEWKTAEIEKRR